MSVKLSVHSYNKETTIFSANFTTQSARLEALPNAAAADIVALTLVDLTSPDDATRENKVFVTLEISTILHHLQLQLRCAARQNILKQTSAKKPKMKARAMIPSTHRSCRFTKTTEIFFCECLQLRKNVIFMQRKILNTHTQKYYTKNSIVPVF